LRRGERRGEGEKGRRGEGEKGRRGEGRKGKERQKMRVPGS
jgi:hypothetical protein